MTLQTHRLRIIFILAALAATALTSGILLGRNQATRQQKPLSSKLDRESVPVVDYEARKSENSNRKAKNRRHNGHKGFVHERYPGTDAVTFNDWEIYVPALPASQSDAIVIGIVERSEAYLSEDKTTVYSEFAIAVESIEKNDTLNLPYAGSPLIAERLGGRVKRPDGETLYRIAGQGIPKVNHRYVLFLKREESDSYRILTAYGLQNNRSIPLDGSAVELRGKWNFDRYHDVEESTFLAEVRRLIAQPVR